MPQQTIRSRPTVEMLAKVPLLQGLETQQLAVLAERCRQKAFGGRETIFHEGDFAAALYIIVSGRVIIQRSGADGQMVHIADFGPDDYFGELSLVDDLQRSADAVTDGPCELVVLSQSDFLHCVRTSPHAAIHLMKTLARRLRSTTERATMHGSLDATGRLNRFLLEEANKVDPKTSDETYLREMTIQEIATRIGTSRETVSRLVARLARSGAIRREGRRFIVVDRRKLQI